MANDLQTLVRERKGDFEKLLDGNTLTADRFASLFFSSLEKSYYLMMCAKESPQTLVRALMQAAAVGVEVNTPLQHACIIPRKSKDGKWTANFQMMYRGWMHLAVVHGVVSDWRAEAVYERDVFTVQPASPNEPIRHVPYIPKPSDPILSRGALMGAYSLIFLPNGMARAKWMPIAEINQIRDRYSESWKAYQRDKSKDDSPWVQRPAEMAIKTAVVNHAKQIRMSGPPQVIIGEQVWQRGPAATIISDADDFDDSGELAEDEKPRAAAKADDKARVSSEATELRPRSTAPSSAPKLVLTPDNPAAVDPGTQAIPDPTIVDADYREVGEEVSDRLLTLEEASDLQKSAVSLGLNLKAQRRVLNAFEIEDYSELKLSQQAEFIKAMGKEAQR